MGSRPAIANPTPSRAAPPPETKDLQTRERILLAAEQLFAQHGFSGVSLRSIMAEAGSNTASAH